MLDQTRKQKKKTESYEKLKDEEKQPHKNKEQKQLYNNSHEVKKEQLWFLKTVSIDQLHLE